MSSEPGRRRFKNRTLQHAQISLVSAMITLAAGNPCHALDYQPGDWVAFPVGTNILMGYTQFATRSKLDNTIVGAVPESHLDSEIGIARFLHYGQILGHTIALQAILPFRALTNGKVNGQDLRDASGIGDPAIAAGMWFINDPIGKRWFSAVNFVSIPIGTYDKSSALNLGSHHWQNDVQVDFTQGFLDKFTVDVGADWIHAWDNDEAGTGHQTLRQDETFGTYLWLGYDVTSLLHRSIMPSALQAWLSVGYAGVYGGAQRLDGVRTGAEGGEQQIRIGYSQFITPKWQALIQISHDVDARGQFKQDVGVLVRIARLF